MKPGIALLLASLALLWFSPRLLAATPTTPPPPCLDVNSSDFPDSSLVDFSNLHDRPTGLHGEMFAGTDGHFYFEDGLRARFWGIDVAKDSVFVSHALIDRAVAAIDRAGFNLVRFHEIDTPDGLLPPAKAGEVRRLDPAKLALLDYWIAQLGKHGIYVYLDLLDYRTFYDCEGVRNAAALGRGAKPYAFFDHRLIDLQEQYARKLLVDHINPYTGLSYADDPTVVLIELCDENGLFSTAKHWTDMVSPYREELRKSWNDWLRARYGDTHTLGEAWTDADGNAGLLKGESLEQGTVRLFPPPQRVGFPAPTDATVNPEAGEVGRVSDRRLFFTHVQEQYFTEMKDYLRNHGVKQPITAVTDFLHLADLHSVADKLDFVGINFYYDHPGWARGNEWHLPAYFENVNPIGDPRLDTLVPRLCASRVYGKPLIIREWNYCWPNKFRSCGMVEMAAYGALQDIDGMILFTYDINPGQRRVEFFDVRNDPARWGLAGMCASIFLQRRVAPARRKVAVGYSTVDTFYPTYETYPTDIYKLGWVSQLSNLFFDQKLARGPDLVLASGRCSGGAYPGSNTVICDNWPTEDLYDHQQDKSTDQLSGYNVATVPDKTEEFTFGGTMFDPGEKQRLTASPGYLLADVQHDQNLRAIGVGADHETCLGFRDMKRRNYVFRKLSAALQLRVALDALGQIYGDQASHHAVDGNCFVSDTGQLKRLINAELLLIDAPRVQGLAGSLEDQALTHTSSLALTTASPMGVLLWLSLDDKPAATSQHWCLKMVTTAVNQGEQKSLHQSNSMRTIYALTALGQPPIDSLGRPSDQPTSVRLNGKVVLSAGMTGGTWELVYEGGQYTLYCDTPDIKFALPALGASVYLTPVSDRGPGQPQQVTQPFTYPRGVRMVLVRPLTTGQGLARK